MMLQALWVWKRWGGIDLLETEEWPSPFNWEAEQDLLQFASGYYPFHLRPDIPSKLFRCILLHKFQEIKWQKYHKKTIYTVFSSCQTWKTEEVYNSLFKPVHETMFIFWTYLSFLKHFDL